MKAITKILFILFFIFTCTLAYAAVPHLINYQGRLTDTNGVPLNGSYNLTFRIYDAESGGNMLWEEVHTGVVIQKGIFGIMLGSVTNLNLPFDVQYFLEIKVGNDVMSPRQRITSAGYAIKAERAEKIRTDSSDPSDGYLSEKVDNSTIKVNPETHKIYSIGPGGWNHVQVFTSDSTWVKPNGVDRVFVEVIGGGGGGGGTASGGSHAGAGGGGGGGYSAKICNVTGSVTATIGAGGTGGISPTAGGTSSFGAFCSATGGSNGSNSSQYWPGPGGGGGSGSGGDINCGGYPGGPGGRTEGGVAGFGGNGGNSKYGSGAVGYWDTGGAGSPYGGGGAGGSENHYGGAGAAGCVIVWWSE